MGEVRFEKFKPGKVIEPFRNVKDCLEGDSLLSMFLFVSCLLETKDFSQNIPE